MKPPARRCTWTSRRAVFSTFVIFIQLSLPARRVFSRSRCSGCKRSQGGKDTPTGFIKREGGRGKNYKTSGVRGVLAAKPNFCARECNGSAQ
eukprot:3468362-Amphidinium_carterae.2